MTCINIPSCLSTSALQDDLTSNEYVHKKAELRYMKIMHMRARGR